MAVFNKQALIAELLDRTELIKASTQPFFRLTDEQLSWQPGPGKWSITEVFAHVTLTNNIYIQSMLRRTTLADDVPATAYHSGWLGDWIYDITMPREDGSVFKVKTLPSLRGANTDGRAVLEEFLRTCDALDDILRHISTKDLEKIRIPFSFARLISVRLGDCLRMVVAHCERHLLQAQRVMTAISR